MNKSLKGLVFKPKPSPKFSKAEKAIAFYISQLFPDCIENARLPELQGLELDIWVPSIRLGIEYDGVLYHKDISRDLEKDILCNKANIKLIRFRESGLPIYETNILDIIKTSGLINLDRFNSDIKWCINVICANFNIENLVDVNLKRDLEKIKSKYTKSKMDSLGIRRC